MREYPCPGAAWPRLWYTLRFRPIAIVTGQICTANHQLLLDLFEPLVLNLGSVKDNKVGLCGRRLAGNVRSRATTTEGQARAGPS